MNYLLICCVLLLLPLNLSWETFYVVKMLGWIFAFLSVKEIYELICIKAQKNGLEKPDVGYEQLKNRVKKIVLFFGVLFFVSMTLKGIFVAAGVSSKAENISSGILGTVSVLGSLVLFGKLLDFGGAFGRNVDFSATEGFSPLFYKVEKTKSTFVKYGVICCINLAGDILNRFVNVKTIQAYAGVLAAVSKIVMYILLIVLTVSVNKMRTEADIEISK